MRPGSLLAPLGWFPPQEPSRSHELGFTLNGGNERYFWKEYGDIAAREET